MLGMTDTNDTTPLLTDDEWREMQVESPSPSGTTDSAHVDHKGRVFIGTDKTGAYECAAIFASDEGLKLAALILDNQFPFDEPDEDLAFSANLYGYFWPMHVEAIRRAAAEVSSPRLASYLRSAADRIERLIRPPHHHHTAHPPVTEEATPDGRPDADELGRMA